jgi:YegS/Rv2252/BmrU family lipid kinase
MRPEELLLIVNPRSGTWGSRRILDDIQGPLRRSGCRLQIVETTAARDAERIAREALLSESSAVGLIGGDGTLHEVLNGLLQRCDPTPPPLAVFPGGTGNTVMEHLACLDPLRVVELFLDNRTTPIDIARVEMPGRTVYCCNIVGWGMVSDINSTAEKLRWLGRARYTLATLLHLIAPRRRRVRLTMDGVEFDRELLLAIGCNTRTTGRGLLLAPSARLDDGRIDLVLVRQASRWRLLRLFLDVMHARPTDPRVLESYQVREFSLNPEFDGSLNLDGEQSGQTPVHVTMLPAAIRLYAAPAA